MAITTGGFDDKRCQVFRQVMGINRIVGQFNLTDTSNFGRSLGNVSAVLASDQQIDIAANLLRGCNRMQGSGSYFIVVVFDYY